MRFHFQEFCDTQNRYKFEIEKNHAIRQANREKIRLLY
jgi:hypothetical protein